MAPTDNPLLKPFSGPRQSVPFDQIEPDHFIPALQTTIQQSLEQIAQIKALNTAHRSFATVIDALCSAQDQVDAIATVFYNLHHANTNEHMQHIAKEFSELCTQFSNDVALDQGLFESVQDVYQNQSSADLHGEQKRLLEEIYQGFVRNGALLSPDNKAILRNIDKELAQLSLTFGDHVLADTQDFELHITEHRHLRGLPDRIVDVARQTAQNLGQEGWVFTLDAPSFGPFMQYCQQRELRQKMLCGYWQRGFRGNESDNSRIVSRIAQLRLKRAQILGFETHADYVLQQRMAKTPARVEAFLAQLLEASKPIAVQEMETLRAFQKKHASHQLERWDVSYYSEMLKKETLNFDSESLRPYFELNRVIQGLFAVLKKLYGLRVERSQEIPVYHPEVQAYSVWQTDTHEQDQFLGLLYLDLFPRNGKRAGAWMTNYREQSQGQRPHVAIVANLTRPTASEPSLLAFDEVLTLFHECGHALHSLFSRCDHSELAGTNVFWDFVELPSQIMENWLYHKECLDLFACHYQTGQPIPELWVQQIQASLRFQAGLATLRQLAYAFLDMAWHNHQDEIFPDVQTLERQAFSHTDLLSPLPVATSISCSFSHIFQGGYSAGYYSYKWAEVLEADAFERFMQEGLFNPDTARDFRTKILEKGNSEDPDLLFKSFRGREPQLTPLLQRCGLLAQNAEDGSIPPSGLS